MRVGLALSLGLAAMVLLAAAEAFAQGPKGGGPAPATVVLSKVVEREEAAGQTFVGTLEPRRRSVVGSAVDGRMVRYPRNSGDAVKKGEVIAELLKESINIEIRNAKAELAFRQAELDEYKNGAEEEEVAQAKAKLAAAKAQWDYAKARYNRAESLFQRNTSITQEDLDLSFSNLTAAEQNHVAAKAAHEQIKDWPRPEKLAQAQARYDAQLEMVNQLEDRLEKYDIKAPFDGYVVSEHTEVGAWISRGDPIAEIIEIAPQIEIAVAVPETSIANLQAAMAQADTAGGLLEAVVKIDALGDQPFVGSVERIVPQADVRSRTFPVKVLLENPAEGKSHKFKAGMICHVTLPVGRRQKVTLVPKDAIVLGGVSPRVMVAEPAAADAATKMPTAKPVPVQIGAAFGDLIQISGQIAVGTSIVTRGNERLMPGQPLNVVAEK